ncbi:hypothetical protein SprV_0200738200 [Sparganum proliferum]
MDLVDTPAAPRPGAQLSSSRQSGGKPYGKKDGHGRQQTEHRLLLTNTLFRLSVRKKVTWMHLWHLLDYVLVRRHSRGVLNRPSTISDAAMARLPQVETNADLDFPPPLYEIIMAVQQLSSGKAPGSDAIPAEIYKPGDPQLIDHLTVPF